MSWRKIGLFCLNLAVTVNCAGQGASGSMKLSEDSTKVKILYFDFVSLPETVQQAMREKAAKVYHQAGVDLEWAPCPTAEGTLAFYPNCTGYKDTTHLMLRILPTARKGMKTDAKGEALLGARIVNVFWDRIQDEATRFNVPIPDLLGQVVAHEIGHLLLGTNSHSSYGIMMGKWRLMDLGAIARGGISFTPQQCEQIQREVKKRQHIESSAASVATKVAQDLD